MSELRRAMAPCITKGDDVTVAYSGGLDSTVLLYALKTLAQELDLVLSACHVNHGLSANAERWQNSCAAICATWDIPFQAFRVQVSRETGSGIEAAARDVRYKVLSENSRQWIAFAHHMDDLAETVLLNMCRGTGLLGLAGMTARSGRYIRPMLNLPRSELVDYALRNQLNWIDDESNADTGYSRNFIRHELMPVVANRFPAISKQLAKTSRHAASAQGLLMDLALIDSAGQSLSAFPLEIAVLKRLNVDRQANLLRCKLVVQRLQAPPESMLVEFIRQLNTFKPDRHPRLSTKRWTLHAKNHQIHLVIEQGSD